MSTRLSIGFPYAADRFGGSNMSSMVLARALEEAGHDVHVLAHGTGRVIDEAGKLGLKILQLPALSDIPGYARPDRFRMEQVIAFGSCRKAIRKLDLDIIHTNDLGMLRTWTAPAAWSATTLIAHWRTNFRPSWSVETGLRLSRAVISVSRYSHEKLPRWAQAKGFVEYNPFDLTMNADAKAKARLAVRRRFNMPDDAAIIGVFGNHILRKRTHVLADIVHAIAETADGRAVYGLACGGVAEPYDIQLDEKIAAFGLSERLIRPGFVRPVEDWMAACDVILAPAINEPLARNILEAQALEIPVIVSTDGGLRELIRHGESGLLCDPDNLEGWISATAGLLNSPAKAAQLAGEGRKTVSTLRPQAHAARIEAIYRASLRGQQDSKNSISTQREAA